jgi:drug/metabolite transporter (DMT)-like permease
MSVAKDYLRLHFVVWIWGFTAILGALITIPAVEIVFYRTLFAFVALGLILKARGQALRLPTRNLLAILGTGLLIAAHWILFFAAARVANVSVCLAGMATCSLWTSFLEPVINKRRIQPFEVILGLFGMLGLYVIFQFDFQYKWGIIMAVASAFIGALFTVFNAGFIKRHNAYTITLYEMIGACAGTALFFPFYARFMTENGLQLVPTPMDWIYLFILALVCTVFAFSESVTLMKRLSAFVINLTVNLEPIYGIALALLIFPERETMPSNFYIGTGIILMSVLVYPVLNKWYKKKPLNLDNLR